MLRFGLVMAVVAALGLALGGIGCSSKKTDKTGDKTAGKTGGHKDHKSGEGKGEHSADIKANLAKLSDADRTSAEKQMTCPVGGGHLGAMGVPIKLTVKGQDVWICCDGCKDSLEKDPDKYLAKLKN